MVLPFVLGAPASGSAVTLHHHHHAMGLVGGLGVVDPIGVTAPLIHTLGYLAVTGALAVVVYEKVGLRILRRAWINVNVVWAVALIAAALMSIVG
jgi:hypothetical protein